MEEIGKGFWADHFVFSSKFNERTDLTFENEWIQLLFGDHRGKQLSFLRQIFKIDKKYYAFVSSKQLDILKQNSMYVGLQKPKRGQPRTDGKIINPSKIDSSKAKKQINVVHNFLTTEIEGIEKESIYYDLAIFRKILNKDLLQKLNKEMLK
jgi:hypothetical protein